MTLGLDGVGRARTPLCCPPRVTGHCQRSQKQPAGPCRDAWETLLSRGLPTMPIMPGVTCTHCLVTVLSGPGLGRCMGHGLAAGSGETRWGSVGAPQPGPGLQGAHPSLYRGCLITRPELASSELPTCPWHGCFVLGEVVMSVSCRIHKAASSTARRRWGTRPGPGLELQCGLGKISAQH